MTFSGAEFFVFCLFCFVSFKEKQNESSIIRF